MKKMYKGLVNSPLTTLSYNILSETTRIALEDTSVLPQPPNLITIGVETSYPETVKLIEVNDGEIVVERGFEGVAKNWQRLTTVSRTLTAYDYNTVVENVTEIDDIKVDKVEGKGLSDENYTSEEKADVATIKNKYNKEDVYTKLQADERIQSIIGTAPDALDTLAEIAIALNNDADFAGTVMRLLGEKVDREQGKSLSDENYSLLEKNKLKNIEEGAIKYVHPPGTNPHGTTKTNVGLGNVDNIKQASKVEFDTHDADNVRHVTNPERTNWNGKSDKIYVDNTFATKIEIGKAGYGDMLKSVYDKNANGKVDLSENSDKLGGNVPSYYATALSVSQLSDKVRTEVPLGAKFTDTIYTHPSSHPASMIVESASKRFISDAEKVGWNGKADKTYVDSSFATRQSTPITVAQLDSLTLKPGFYHIESYTPALPDNTLGPTTYYNIIQLGDYSGGGKTQIAFNYQYQSTSKRMWYRTCDATTWSKWFTVATLDDIPTKVSQLLNDSGFATVSQLNYKVKTPVPAGAKFTDTIVPLSNSVASASGTTGASSSAVKTAYDRANEAFQSASNGKTQLASAITGKGVASSGADSFLQMASKIGQISTGVNMAQGSLSVNPGQEDVSVSGLNFKPNLVIVSVATMQLNGDSYNSKQTIVWTGNKYMNFLDWKGNESRNSLIVTHRDSGLQASVLSNLVSPTPSGFTFKIITVLAEMSLNWIAFE